MKKSASLAGESPGAGKKRRIGERRFPGLGSPVAVAVLLAGISAGCAGIKNLAVGSGKKAVDVTKNAGNEVADQTSQAAVSALAAAFPLPSVDFPEPSRIAPLPDEVRYDEACFLCSHNSYSAVENGWFPYRQQLYGEAKQLDLGVRAFMFDTWNDTGRIVLSHGNPAVQKWIRPIPASRGEVLPGFISRLDFLRAWLQAHPAEVVTLILEDNVHDSVLFDETIRLAGLQQMVLSAAVLEEYRKNAETDRWPSLGWMRGTNRRLVILSDWSDGNWLLPEWKHAIENQHGTLNVSKAARERSESARYRRTKRHLLILNYFPVHPLRVQEFEGATAANVVPKMIDFLKHQIENFHYYNDRGAEELIRRIRRRGLQGRYKGITPTFLALDNVHEGSPIRHVEALNNEARCLAAGRSQAD
jgi:hypothetical protein